MSTLVFTVNCIKKTDVSRRYHLRGWYKEMTHDREGRKEKEGKDPTFVHILTSWTTTSCKTHGDMVWQEMRKKLIDLRFFDRFRI